MIDAIERLAAGDEDLVDVAAGRLPAVAALQADMAVSPERRESGRPPVDAAHVARLGSPGNGHAGDHRDAAHVARRRPPALPRV